MNPFHQRNSSLYQLSQLISSNLISHKPFLRLTTSMWRSLFPSRLTYPLIKPIMHALVNVDQPTCKYRVRILTSRNNIWAAKQFMPTSQTTHSSDIICGFYLPFCCNTSQLQNISIQKHYPSYNKQMQYSSSNISIVNSTNCYWG